MFLLSLLNGFVPAADSSSIHVPPEAPGLRSGSASRSPWSWIPSLYLAEGLPNALVTTVALLLYKALGISNTRIAVYTGLFYLPWVIKPLWSPVVDLLGTRR